MCAWFLYVLAYSYVSEIGPGKYGSVQTEENMPNIEDSELVSNFTNNFMNEAGWIIPIPRYSFMVS